jgi:hypothetical protein
MLQTGAYASLAQQETLARAAALPKSDTPALTFTTNAIRQALEAAPLIQLEHKEETKEAPWWLVDAPPAAGTLADRVDARVWELLIQQTTWQREQLVNAIYAHFSGSLTPDLRLVQICIDSYSVQEGETLRLRPEDDPVRRATELKTLRDDLVSLGQRLGFEVEQQDGWDVRWLEEGKDSYVFSISTLAALGQYLLTKRAADEGAQRCLVLPGGRAQLVDLKLQRNPHLTHAVEKDGWQFIKFRHLRRLVATEELDRHALKTVLGLDPIAEQEAAQIPLF